MFRKHIAGPVLVAAVAIMFTAAHTSAASGAATRPRFKAVAFDYFVLFNPDSVISEVEQIVPGKGRQLTDVWRTRQFEYAWLRSITNRYADFSVVTEDALVYAAGVVKVQLTPQQRQRLLEAYLHLTPHCCCRSRSECMVRCLR
jgi:2-haloacid dehalogenase